MFYRLLDQAFRLWAGLRQDGGLRHRLACAPMRSSVKTTTPHLRVEFAERHRRGRLEAVHSAGKGYLLPHHLRRQKVDEGVTDQKEELPGWGGCEG